jgi:F-type H+-transporting ATPase subunit b
MKPLKTILTLLILPIILFASSAYASAEGASPWNSWMLLWRVINTIALIALLGYFMKKPLLTFFSERKAQIERDLEEAREQRDKAELIIGEYKEKLTGMEMELEKMRAELKKSAEVESEKVLSNAEKMAATMVESAKVTAEQELRKAKIALKNESVELAVNLAETLIREKIDANDRSRIVEDYLVRVGGMK